MVWIWFNLPGIGCQTFRFFCLNDNKFKTWCKNIRSINFFSIKLDDFPLDASKRIGIIKIDVEGAEYEVIKDALTIIDRDRPIIICEILNAHSKDSIEFMQKRTDKILDLFKVRKYNVFRLIKKQNRLEYLETLENIVLDIYNINNSCMCDYLFIPEENKDEIKEIVRIV